MYFPNKIPKVAYTIEEHLDTKWLFGTVRGGRGAAQGRNMDIQRHLNGPWRFFDHGGCL